MNETDGGTELPVQGAWSRASRHLYRSSGHLFDSVVEANRAMVSAFTGVDIDEEAVDADHVHEPHPYPSMEYRHEDWETTRSIESRADIGVGATVSFSKTITNEDVTSFAEISGDTNRLHLDDEFASHTRFKRRIVHGTLISGLISGALARIPGLTIYLSQDLNFLGPVDIGDRLTATVTVVEDIGDDRYRLTTVVTNEDDDVIIDGEAVVLIDSLPVHEADHVIE